MESAGEREGGEKSGRAELEGRSATYTFLYLSQINYMESGTNHDFARKLILRAFPFGGSGKARCWRLC